ncbi:MULTISPECIES: Uma2 family endonuclease [Capnocytophaga]|uniref:Uma2 family endonuclease n=1 Tax=Capnocytophaga TaxID=1016 RepID=UPI00027C4C61|nr:MULTISPECIES: Uma2 family endonuclease [Capnocytophaga]EJU25284.1 putative restriction endonuclease [Capnocytophaga sp. CM59]
MSTVITNIDQLDLVNGIYTYADYLMWKIKDRVEILKGKIFKMSPAPAISHQSISFNLSGLLFMYFYNKPCKVFASPFDVVLKNKDGKEDTVVQPDLSVVCDPEKLADGKRCQGAPDLIIEILSPGNSKKELKNKYELYQEAGVREYWLVHPQDEYVIINVLENNQYRALPPFVDKEVTSVIFPDLSLQTEDIFRL